MRFGAEYIYSIIILILSNTSYRSKLLQFVGALTRHDLQLLISSRVAKCTILYDDWCNVYSLESVWSVLQQYYGITNPLRQL